MGEDFLNPVFSSWSTATYRHRWRHDNTNKINMKRALFCIDIRRLWERKEDTKSMAFSSSNKKFYININTLSFLLETNLDKNDELLVTLEGFS